MTQSVIIEGSGGPEVLKPTPTELLEPKANEVQIEHTAIEVNYIDIYHRMGRYPLSTNPKIPGVSAVGNIVKVGSEVKDFSVGDRVAYVSSQAGAYTEARNIDSQAVVILPKELDDRLLASCLLKGLTAHTLACQVYVVRPATAVLIHAASGGVGRLLSQWCNDLGAYVIGTVGSEAKRAIALSHGCHLAINYNTDDWITKVQDITRNIGVTVVYDGVGQATYSKSLNCLMNMGMMVLYGAASGSVDKIDTSELARKSLFFTRPSVFHYKSTRSELLRGFDALFEKLKDGNLKVPAPIEFKLADAGQAHKLIESRENLSSVVLVP